MKFIEVFGYRCSDALIYSTAIFDFDWQITHTKELKKGWCKNFLVKVSDIIRIQQFQANEESYYLVIVANQYGQGNIGKEKNEFGLFIDDGEYVQIKEFLNQ